MSETNQNQAQRHPWASSGVVALVIALVVLTTAFVLPKLGGEQENLTNGNADRSEGTALNADFGSNPLLGLIDETICDSTIASLLSNILSLVDLSDALGALVVLGPLNPTEAIACFLPGPDGGPERAQTVYKSTTDPLSEVSVDYMSLCSESDTGCTRGLFYGAGLLPTSVDRLSVLTPDGVTTNATLLYGAYVFKHVQETAYDLDQPVVVTIYDDDDNVIDQRNVNEMPNVPAGCLEGESGC